MSLVTKELQYPSVRSSLESLATEIKATDKELMLGEQYLGYLDRADYLNSMKSSIDELDELFETMKEVGLNDKELKEFLDNRKEIEDEYHEISDTINSVDDEVYHLFPDLLEFQTKNKIEIIDKMLEKDEVENIDYLKKVRLLYEDLLGSVNRLQGFNYLTNGLYEDDSILEKYKDKNHQSLKQKAISNVVKAGYSGIKDYNLSKILRDYKKLDREDRINIQKLFYIMCIESKPTSTLVEYSTNFLETVYFFGLNYEVEGKTGSRAKLVEDRLLNILETVKF